MYEIYMETCGQSAQNQVKPATFGKVGCENENTVFTEQKKSVQGNWGEKVRIYLGLVGSQWV